MKNEFKKEDFYSGMRIETKNGNEYIIVESSVLGIIGVRENNWLSIDESKEDLSFYGSDEFTIMKIYDCPYRTEQFMNINDKGNLIWERN